MAGRGVGRESWGTSPWRAASAALGTVLGLGLCGNPVWGQATLPPPVPATLPAEEPAPIELPTPAARSHTAAPLPKADAGDDQIGLVDRQITLNGSRSLPGGALGYRWLQLGGPQPVALTQDGPFLSFTPRAAGVYKFALLVATGSRISEPDQVEVLVGALPTASPGTPAPAAPAAAATIPPPPPAAAAAAPAPPPAPLATDELARSVLAGMPGGPEVGERLGVSVEGVAARVDLYRTYADLLSEMSRRLDGLLPTDPAGRSAWDQRVFLPLSSRLIEQLRLDGLDLIRPESAQAPLTPAQKQRLAGQLVAIAAGFKAAAPRR